MVRPFILSLVFALSFPLSLFFLLFFCSTAIEFHYNFVVVVLRLCLFLPFTTQVNKYYAITHFILITVSLTLSDFNSKHKNRKNVFSVVFRIHKAKWVSCSLSLSPCFTDSIKNSISFWNKLKTHFGTTTQQKERKFKLTIVHPFVTD